MLKRSTQSKDGLVRAEIKAYSVRVQPEYATQDYMDFFYSIDEKFATLA